jgi:hypothetical protein
MCQNTSWRIFEELAAVQLNNHNPFPDARNELVNFNGIARTYAQILTHKSF